MKLFLLSELLLLFCYGVNSTYNNILYQSNSDITPSQDNQIAIINIGDEITFSMDIQVNSVTNMASIFQCGTGVNGVWAPGMIMHFLYRKLCKLQNEPINEKSSISQCIYSFHKEKNNL